MAADAIPAQVVVTGETTTVDLSQYFGDPDGDALTYGAASSDATVVTVGVSGNILTLAAIARGTATVTVTALDPSGLSARQSFQVLPPPPGFIAGTIVVAEDPTQRPEWGFGPDMFGYMARIHDEGKESDVCDRPCNEVAVAMGSDTVFADRRGQFGFENVEGNRQHRIHVVEADHPRKRNTEWAPSTFWHYVMFDTVIVSTVWRDTVEVVLNARQVPASIAAYIGQRPEAPARQGLTERIPGVTVTLYASDGATILERRTTDELGEVVFRPLRRDRTYFSSPAGGYDRNAYECDDRRLSDRPGPAFWQYCTDLNAPPWAGGGSGGRPPGSSAVVELPRGTVRQPGGR